MGFQTFLSVIETMNHFLNGHLLRDNYPHTAVTVHQETLGSWPELTLKSLDTAPREKLCSKKKINKKKSHWKCCLSSNFQAKESKKKSSHPSTSKNPKAESPRAMCKIKWLPASLSNRIFSFPPPTAINMWHVHCEPCHAVILCPQFVIPANQAWQIKPWLRISPSLFSLLKIHYVGSVYSQFPTSFCCFHLILLNGVVLKFVFFFHFQSKYLFRPGSAPLFLVCGACTCCGFMVAAVSACSKPGKHQGECTLARGGLELWKCCRQAGKEGRWTSFALLYVFAHCGRPLPSQPLSLETAVTLSMFSFSKIHVKVWLLLESSFLLANFHSAGRFFRLWRPGSSSFLLCREHCELQ